MKNEKLRKTIKHLLEHAVGSAHGFYDFPYVYQRDIVFGLVTKLLDALGAIIANEEDLAEMWKTITVYRNVDIEFRRDHQLGEAVEFRTIALGPIRKENSLHHHPTELEILAYNSTHWIRDTDPKGERFYNWADSLVYEKRTDQAASHVSGGAL